MRRRRVTPDPEPVRRDPDELRAEANAAEAAAHERAESVLEAAEIEASTLRARAAEIDAELIAEAEAAELAREQEVARHAYAAALDGWALALSRAEEAEAARTVVEERMSEAEVTIERHRAARDSAVTSGAALDSLAEVQAAVDRAEALQPLVASQLQRTEQILEEAEAVVTAARSTVDEAWHELESLHIEAEFADVRPPWLPIPKASTREFLAYLETERPELYGWLLAEAAFDAYAALLPDEPTAPPSSHISVVRQ